MLKKIYLWLHHLTSGAEEQGEYSSGHWAASVRKKALDFCSGIHGRFLEVGCGEGLFISKLAAYDPKLQIWGIDNSTERLFKAKERCKNLQNVNLSVADALNLEFEGEYFDNVACINVLFNLESVDAAKKVIIEMKRVCKKGGSIILDFRSSLNPLLKLKYSLAKYYDETVKNLPLRCYSPRQIEGLLKESGFEIIKKDYVGALLFKRFAPVILLKAQKI
ncbi:MAG: class I SAM-dependent methyltransferase [Candidatus Omnitrophica bacterium]|nr:class I SAM-dependent methyltransferase [Candidatus Omnitrophota bacterium]